MPKFHASLTNEHIAFINAAPLFYVASAPWAGTHINISPKGQPSQTFSILSPTSVAYLDATGHGCETIAHVYENGRATLLFSSSGANPRTLRLFCSARVVEKWDQHFSALRAKMASENGESVDITGARAIIVLKIVKVQTSCGFGALPGVEGGDAMAFADHDGDDDGRARETLEAWAAKKIERREMMDFQKVNNTRSLDGLPGLKSARMAQDQNFAVEDTKVWFQRVARQWDAVALGVALGMLLMILLGLVDVVHIEPRFLTHILNFQKRQLGDYHDEL
ncbi:pyridoxamine phosphate oxidase family protein [Didymella exigua CBS 183.55]|uniref:Pyridoxamine phosphate oxidase family protein n=1 Tax=Didymella exigua CBS 183.55 TaxID=1150837 RepID=A0A6A5RFJ8_9PLEO|nr:pyridoxamine phosphate oxidase family protein [Didymella exigua CBS 183.55]KAF1924447.1 pyridoxamine phosphate oxidase family protein [Didymella exigua CBS 183.55]